jgi:deoxycytidine triphosphate deaminase
MISTESDAKVKSVDIYDRSDIPVDELNWAFTGEETRAFRGEFRLPFTDKEMNYWVNRSEKFFESTRSTAARNATHFWIDDWENEEDGMRGTFEGRSLQNYVDFEEGNKIFRILMYEEDDQLSAQEVKNRAGEIIEEDEYGVGGNVLIDDNTLEIPIDRRLNLSFAETAFSELEGKKDQYINYEGREFGGENDVEKFEVLETVPISMPDDLFARINDTSIKGHTYHLSSTFIDPGYDDRIVVEVAAPTKAPIVSKQPEYLPGWGEEIYLEMELYESTELKYGQERENRGRN